MAKKIISHGLSEKTATLILVCFFLSGFTGLIYEILWTRMIVKIIGGAPFAVSIVLTVFMGGLGMGAYLAGRTIDRIREPIKLVKIYGILELVVGVCGLAIPLLLGAFEPVYAVIYNRLFDHFMLYNLLTFVGCSVLLCIPVICMGATLPVLCKFYVTRLSHLGTHTGRLYGLNTIGAAFGALLCGFWLINLLGMWGTLILAVFINAVIGLSCVLAGFWIQERRFDTERGTGELQQYPEGDTADAGKGLRYPAAVSVAALAIFGLSGFCAMSYEVIWTKLLGLVVGPTTYSFTIVLVTFILGLAAGSMIFGWLADKTGRPMQLLIYTQIGAGLFVLSTSQLLGNSQLFFAKLIFCFKEQFILLSISKAVILFGFMILPTLCLGATFPLVGKIYTTSISRVGRSIGFAYTVNTIGAVLGSFCAGFVFIPLLGKEKSLSVVIGIQLLASLAAAVAVPDEKRETVLRKISLRAAAVVGLLLCFYLPSWNHYVLSRGKYHRFDEIGADVKSYGWVEALLRGSKILASGEHDEHGQLVYYGEGIGGFTTVLRYTEALGKITCSMMNSGKVDASTRGDMKTQTLSAHFPMLFHRNPKTVMVLGLASGITAGEVLYYPVERLDVIDINRQVVTGSDFFLPWNNNVLSNPKTHLIIQDGRAHLQLTRQKYDVIISEPSNPWMAGLAALFTQNFFELAMDRLNEDGIFVQFIHSYQMDWPTFALVGRTFVQVFPNSLLVLTSPSGTGGDYLMVGFKGKERLVLENAERKLSYVKQSKNVTISDARLLYRLVVCEDLVGLFGGGPVNTDSRPMLEFLAPRLMYSSDLTIGENIRSRGRLSPETKRIISDVVTNIDAQIDFAAYALSLYEPFWGMVELSKAAAPQKERFFELVERYCADNIVIDYSVFGDDDLVRKCRLIQIKAIEDNIERLPDKVVSYSYLAKLYLEEGMLDEAINSYTNALRIEPEYTDAQSNLGVVLARQGRLDEAIIHFNEAIRIKPDFAEAHSNFGYVLMHIGREDEAIMHLNRALQIDPGLVSAHSNLAYALSLRGRLRESIKEYEWILKTQPNDASTHNDLGVALAQEGRVDEALVHFAEALRIRPDWAGPMTNLAWFMATRKGAEFYNPQEAVRLAERACELTNYSKADFLNTLAASYAAAGRFTEAVSTAQKALELAKSSGQDGLMEEIQGHLALYKAGQPFVESSPKFFFD